MNKESKSFLESFLDAVSGRTARRELKEKVEQSIAITSPVCRVTLEFENGFIREATGREAAKWHKYLMTIGHNPHANVDFKEIKWITIKEKNK